MAQLHSTSAKDQVKPRAVAVFSPRASGGGSGLGTTCKITSGFLDKDQDPLLYLGKYYWQSRVRNWLPKERVSSCLRAVVPRERFVEVMKKDERCFYKNLVTCGSIWMCPLCAAKISQKRCLEVREGIQKQEARGGTVLMVTSTLPHYAFQGLTEVLEGFSLAREIQRRQWSFKRLKEEFHIEGSIRSLEVTYGANGWHVHSHELLFVGPGYRVFRMKLEAAWLELWKAACVKAGLKEPNARGVQVDGGEKAAQYVNKWGMDAELTKSHIKIGREGQLTAWDLLRMEKKELFIEYARAFKGKKQLHWSKGLREFLGLGEEKSDEELAAQVEEEAALLAQLDLDEWAVILKEKKRVELLRVAHLEGKEGIARFVRQVIEEREKRFQPIEGVPF